MNKLWKHLFRSAITFSIRDWERVSTVFLCLEGGRRKIGKKRNLISPGHDKGNASMG